MPSNPTPNPHYLAVFLLWLAFGPTSPSAGVGIDWRELEPGLDYASVAMPQTSSSGDSMVRVLRADPKRFGLRLLNASADPARPILTARQWAAASGDVLAVTNASMYQQDGVTSVSLMRRPGHVNNSHLSKDRTVLAFDPTESGVAPVRLIDRGCDDYPLLQSRYGSLVQSIRMISCRRHNVWSPQEAQWSTAAFGVDGAGRFMFLMVRSPYSTHDLIEGLLALPLDLRGAMYLEGGRPAQLYLKAGGLEVESVGSKGSAGLGGNQSARPIPNALAIYRLESTPNPR